jgi:hypothetical protein
MINFGGRGRFCPFTFKVLPAPDSPGVEVVSVAGADEEVTRWLPSLQAGVKQYCDERLADGILLLGIRIEIHAVRTHPVDTYEDGVRSLGHSFLHEVYVRSEEVADRPPGR